MHKGQLLRVQITKQEMLLMQKMELLSTYLGKWNQTTNDLLKEEWQCIKMMRVGLMLEKMMTTHSMDDNFYLLIVVIVLFHRNMIKQII